LAPNYPLEDAIIVQRLKLRLY